MFSDDDRIELRKFLHSASGQNLLHHLRENTPTSPIAVDATMQVHHVQVNFGFGLGLDARLKQLIELSTAKKPTPEPEAPVLFDTKSLR